MEEKQLRIFIGSGEGGQGRDEQSMHSLKDLITHRTSSMASSSTGRVPQGEVIMDVSRFFGIRRRELTGSSPTVDSTSSVRSTALASGLS